MFGGLLDKITASLGKSFIFAGLLPAAVLLAIVECYRYGLTEFSSQLPSTASDLKDITALGIIWLAAAFILFAIRTWIFDRFQKMPRGRLAPLLLRRWWRRRDQAETSVRKLEWQYTVVQWPTTNFDLDMALYQPPFIATPTVERALRKSQRARSRLDIMVAQKRTYPGFWDCHELLDGLCALFLIAIKRADYSPAEQGQIAADLTSWRSSFENTRKKVINNLSLHVEREWAAAFEENLLYAKGPWIYPTAIGNRLAALDDYAQLRYGMATVTMWDRLWWVLPAAARQEISDLRLSVETLLTLCFALSVSAIGIGVLIVSSMTPTLAPDLPPPTLQRILLGLASAIFAVGCYRGTIFAVKALAAKMMTLTDAYRLQLLVALGFKPKTIKDEVEIFSELNLFFVQARPRQQNREITIPKSNTESGKATKVEKQSEKQKDDDEDDHWSG